MTGKPATRTFYGHTRRNLRAYFGEGRLLQSIRHEDADGWRAWLVEHEKLSAATVARRVIAARTIWRKAVRWKLVSENPFAGVKGGHQENDSRKQFIRREVIDKLIAQTPDRWIGNSPAVAARHYAMSVDLNADFERAADCGPAPKAQQSATTSERQPATTGAEKPRCQAENEDLVMAGQTETAGDEGGKWAIQDSNL